MDRLSGCAGGIDRIGCCEWTSGLGKFAECRSGESGQGTATSWAIIPEMSFLLYQYWTECEGGRSMYLCTVIAPPFMLSTTDCFFRPARSSGVMLLHRSTLVFRIVRVHSPYHRAYLLISSGYHHGRVTTHDGGMIASSALITCTAFRSGFTAILHISVYPKRSCDKPTWILCPASPHRKQIRL